MTDIAKRLTASHWGPGLAIVEDGRLSRVEGHPSDPAPSKINDNIASSLAGGARVLRPAIRRGWLAGDRAGGGLRGRDSFVEMPWDEVLDLVAAEIARVRAAHGNRAIFGGSYGWASAGRIHHAQSLLKRFLNSQGGFVASHGNYSFQTALVLMPHIVGSYRAHVQQATRWRVIERNTELLVMFGGMAVRNTQVSDGGMSCHRMEGSLRACAAAGIRMINVSPLRQDAEAAEWLAIRPGADTALMMGLAHTLISEGLHDRAFLDRYTTGFDRIEAYLMGRSDDGVVKDADWAETRTRLPAERIRELARQMAARRTMITCAASLQRADFGEQPLWMTVTLAALLGQIGLPGGGYTIGYAVNGTIGHSARPFLAGKVPQGENPVSESIPVAMIADMLLNPGAEYPFDGQTYRFPDIRLVWWAGGNPFHHHQDLRRLHRAFQRPETVIVNEINWTATARHADIVLPVAAPQERSDFAAGNADAALMPMPQITAPAGEAKLEFEIYAKLAARLGNDTAFTEGLSLEGWTHRVWAETQAAAADHGLRLPDWETFLQGDIVKLPDPAPEQVFLAEFRADPLAHPLPTPSGRIELYSERIAQMALPDCPGFPVWQVPLDEARRLGRFALLSGQPGTRLHSQLDNGAHSLAAKIKGREPVLIHPEDAAGLGIADGDVVELSNARGRCLAGARLTDGIRRGCLFLWTGAWYDPDYDAPEERDRHGNPNTLTHDLRSSSLSQGPAAHSVRVDLARFDGPVPPITVHDPPVFVARDAEP